MGSLAAAKGKADELKRWAEQMGEILSRKAFGEQGPDLQTALADMEELLGPFLEQMAAGFLRTSVTDQAERLPDEAPCPTCGVGCPVAAQGQERHMTTERGDFRFSERVGHCDRCGRSFFPSADGPQD
jgi:anaerobic selenocysteine-containing dehydrogenase